MCSHRSACNAAHTPQPYVARITLRSLTASGLAASLLLLPRHCSPHSGDRLRLRRTQPVGVSASYHSWLSCFNLTAVAAAAGQGRAALSCGRCAVPRCRQSPAGGGGSGGGKRQLSVAAEAVSRCEVTCFRTLMTRMPRIQVTRRMLAMGKDSRVQRAKLKR